MARQAKAKKGQKSQTAAHPKIAGGKSQDDSGGMAVNNLSLSDTAYARIRQDIVTCVLAPGRSLTEQQFREIYDLTIATTRAALSRLVQDGMIKAEPRKGYVIAPLTLRDIIDVFDARILVESGAARLAADVRTAESVERIEAAARDSIDQLERGPGFVISNRRFHTAVAEATQNARVIQMVERLLDDSDRILHLGLVRYDQSERYNDEHLEVVDLIRSGNGDEAARLTAKHIEGGKQIVIAAIRASSQIMNLELVDLVPRGAG